MRKLSQIFLFFILYQFVLSQQNDTIKTYYLGEVEVTAYRAGGEVLNLPMSVSLLDFSDFALKRKMDLSDVMNFAPGVLVQSRSGGGDVRLTVRGFGARGYGDKSNAGTIRGIKLLVDGFPITEPDGRTSIDFVDLLSTERIEIMRTNASALFGNASGGIINFETFDVRNSFAEAIGMYGSFGLWQTNFKVGVKFETGDAILTGTIKNFDGWRQNSSNQKKQIYSVIKTRIAKETQLKIITGFVSNLFYIPGPLTIEQFNSSPALANQTYFNRKERRYNRIGKIGLNLTSPLAKNHIFDLRIFFEPKVLQRSERGTFRDFNRYFFGSGFTYQFYADEIPFRPKFILGYDDSYQDGTILFYNLKDGERGDSLRTNKREGGRTGGFVLKIEINPVNNFSVAFGGRYDFHNYISEIYPAGVKRITQKDVLKMNKFTPYFSLLFKTNENNSVYFTLSGGVEAPAFNEVDPPPELKDVSLNPLLKPMSSQTFEFGWKGVSTVGNSIVSGIIYSFSFFRIDVKNEIVPYNNGAWFFSAGESRRYGVEVSNLIKFSKFADLNLALTYLNAKYLKYENDLGNLSGKLVPGIPQLWGSAEFKINFKSFVINPEIIYIGRYYADDLNELEITPYTLLNISLGSEFTIANLKVSINAGVENLFDKKYISSVFINPERRQPYAYIEPGLPRNWFVSFSLAYF
jgi:iron complex outermembrane receptor protein